MSDSRNVQCRHRADRLADEGPPGERGQAHAEQRQRQAGGDLIGLQRDREKAEDQRHQHAGRDGGEIAECEAAGAEADGEGRHCADQHHAFDTEVEHAGLFGDQFAERGIDQRRGGDHGADEDRDDLISGHEAHRFRAIRRVGKAQRAHAFVVTLPAWARPAAFAPPTVVCARRPARRFRRGPNSEKPQQKLPSPACGRGVRGEGRAQRGMRFAITLLPPRF